MSTLAIVQQTSALQVNAPPVQVIEIAQVGVQGAPAVGGNKVDVVSNVIDGQVDFVLTALPGDPAKVRMHVNGHQFRPPASFAVTGQVVRWQSEFLINAADEIEFSYPL